MRRGNFSYLYSNEEIYQACESEGLKVFLKIVFCAVLSAGLILVSLDIFKIPYIKTSRAVKSLLKKRSKKESAAELWLSGLSVRLAKIIHINEYKRISLANDLASADIEWIGLVIKDLEDNKKSSPSGEE